MPLLADPRMDRLLRPLHGMYDRLGRMRHSFRQGHPWTDGQDKDAPVFIIGSGRSGNTLVRAMLVAGGDLAIPPESYILPRIYRDHSRFGWMDWDDYATLLLGRAMRHPGMAEWGLDLGDAVERARRIPLEERSLARLVSVLYEEWADRNLPGASRWGDKTPLNTLWLPRIERMFPDARYVHVLRDGRDVALSYVKAGIYPNVAQAARRWRRSVLAARRHGRRVGPQRYHELRYERLVSAPDATLRALCDFLDLDPSGMGDFWKTTEKLGDTRLPHHRNLRRPIDTGSVGRWRRGLDREQQMQVLAVAGNDLRRFGYGEDGR